MCGINGFIKKIKLEDSKNIVNLMNKAIIHRGPDDQGCFVDKVGDGTSVALGQVRLSIIDLTDAGFQPMFYDKNCGAFSQKHNSVLLDSIGSESIRIVFNGEIYNYQEIRENLIKKGYNFSSNTDTEVILASYIEWGEDCLSRFNGMRSFVIYDPNKKELFCSRDRLGKKPFYYYYDGGQFIFSSEIKGILEHKELKINQKDNIDPEALDFYFTMGYIPSPWSIYKNVKKLEARHFLKLKVNDDKILIDKKCYYDIPKYEPINDKGGLLKEGKELLEKTVKDRMFTSDVPVGAFLSGGLDSSSVVAEMTKWIDPKKLHTFSIGFEGKYDESKYIHIVEKDFGTVHHHKYFRQGDFENMLGNISFHYDEPFADYSNFPTTFVSKLAKENVTVSLSGDGGDEIFGGYMMHQVGAQMSLIRKIPRFIRKILFFIVPKTSNNLSALSKIKEAFRVSLLPIEDFYANIGGSTLYKPDVYKKWTREKFKELLEKNNGNFTQSMIDFDLFYNTMGDNFLVKTDRASMAQPIEIRSPFCDIRWIEWGRKVPTKWKVNRRNTKIIMRDIIEGIVPYDIVNRGKQGFSPPLDKWILERKYVKDLNTALDYFYNYGILSKEWTLLYKRSVFSNDNTVFNVYKIRLFLLLDWYNKWIKKIS